jgi:hypothetical protein
MKIKRKTIAIVIVLLLVVMTFNIVEANDKTKENKTIETSSIKIISFEKDGSIVTDSIQLSEEEIGHLEEYLTKIIEKISLDEEWNVISLFNLFKYFLKNNIFIRFFKKIINIIKDIFNNPFIVSIGRCLKLNPFKRSSVKFRTGFSFWRYSSGSTFVFTPLGLNSRFYHGRQFGSMRGFIGVYMFFARSYPEKSTTFFIGHAKNVNVFQFAFQ